MKINVIDIFKLESKILVLVIFLIIRKIGIDKY